MTQALSRHDLRRLLTLGLLGLAFCVGGCAAEEPQAATNGEADPDGDGGGGKEDSGDGEGSLCVAVRGNGARIFAHFGAMARIHEHYGLIDGVAGGSSGSISSFLTESIYLNPEISVCADGPCSEQESAQRIALLFKSLEGYVGFLGGTDEAQAFSVLAPLAASLREAGVESLIANGKLEEARQALLAIFESPELRDLINPEIFSLLTQSPDPAFHTMDLWGAISGFGSFAVDSDRILVRPGLVNFEAVAEKVGRIGSFYAAYGPSDSKGWQDFMQGCAAPSRGKTWGEVAGLDAGDGRSCGEHFNALLGGWREELLKDEDAHASRIDDPIGGWLPAMISTSVLEGDAVEVFSQARADYLQGKDYRWDVDFDDVAFGYWGSKHDLEYVEANLKDYDDAKTARMRSLGEASWRKALSLSPAEPGLARALEIKEGQVSAGGWSDLAPSLVLKNMGCDEVILVTRQGAVQGGFGPSVARLLGMDDATDEALYKLDGDSAVRKSLEEADGIWCTNWDGFTDAQFSAVFADAYQAPMETNDPVFTKANDPYPNTTDKIGAPACTPGVAAPVNGAD